MNKLKDAFEQFDQYNRQDPVLYRLNDESWPQEYFFAVQAYEWVKKLDPEASEELLLASRSHHIGRWEIPRDQYPEGRVGYLNWRNKLADFHAGKAAGIMEKGGYEPGQIDRVKQLIRKKNMKNDREVQVLENALCLVFLQFQYEDFRRKHPREKVIHILRKSLLKMDLQGREQALSLHYSEKGKALVTEALDMIAN